MLYDRPIYRPLADSFVDVEFGDELHLALNFRVIGLNLSLAERSIRGVTETVPSNRALMIAYDSAVIRQAALIDALREREEEATRLRRAPSRLVTMKRRLVPRALPSAFAMTRRAFFQLPAR